MPVELLMQIREAAGSPAPLPDDRIRDEELPYAEFVAAQVQAGFRTTAIQRLLRVQGDALRADGRDGVGLVEVRGHRAGDGGGQAADEIHGIEFGDHMSVAERTGHLRDVPPAAGPGLDRPPSSKGSR